MSSLTSANSHRHVDNDTDTDPFWSLHNRMLGFPHWGMGFAPPSLDRELSMRSSLPLGLDLTEEEDKWVVHADLPGYKDEDVDVSIVEGVLTVRGKREKVYESKTGSSHRVERSFGEVKRSINLPKGADVNNVHAHLENGVLEVNFPKLALENGEKKIPITQK